MIDEQLARDVSDELHWDPKVDNRDIAVCVSAGLVTLRGTVGSPWEKREANRAAQRIRGYSASRTNSRSGPRPTTAWRTRTCEVMSSRR